MASTCDLWDGCLDSYGYGVTTIAGKRRKAHRLAYVQAKGLTFSDIEGMCVCHSCDTPACVNPDHLFLGTVADNMADKKNKDRAAAGEANGRCKLPDSNIPDIFRLRAEGMSQQKIADRFGLSQPHVSRILSRKTRS